VFVRLRSAPQPAYDATNVSAKVLAEQLGIVSEGDSRVAEIAPLLPATGRPGGHRADHRQVVNGILWKLATGVPWRDLPERYGPWQTCSERFRRWQADGTCQRLLAHAQTRSDAVGEVDWAAPGHRHPLRQVGRQLPRPGWSWPPCCCGSPHEPSDRPWSTNGGVVWFFTVIVWRDQAEPAPSPSRRQPGGGRRPAPAADWTVEDGSARSTVEVVADGLGPSLRWATASPVRAARSVGDSTP
jgi:transposase